MFKGMNWPTRILVWIACGVLTGYFTNMFSNPTFTKAAHGDANTARALQVAVAILFWPVWLAFAAFFKAFEFFFNVSLPTPHF